MSKATAIGCSPVKSGFTSFAEPVALVPDRRDPHIHSGSSPPSTYGAQPPFGRRRMMAKELRCADVGMDCDFVAKAETHEELMQKVATHAREVHGITEITPELKEKVERVIRDG